MKKMMTRAALFCLTAITISGLSLPLIEIFSGKAQAAAPASLNIDGTECKLSIVEIPQYELAIGGIHFPEAPSTDIFGVGKVYRPLNWYFDGLANEIGDYSSVKNNASIVNDLNSLSNLANNTSQQPTSNNGSIVTVSEIKAVAILFDAVQAGNGDPQKACRNVPNVLFSRPSAPNQFIGTIKGYGDLIVGTLDATAKKITFTNSVSGGTVYNVGGDNAIFSRPELNGVQQVGFCSDSPTGTAYSACMTAYVVDFNTITYRGETYKLKEWKGDQSVRMDYVLDPTTSIARGNLISSCSALPMFRIDGDSTDKLKELTLDGRTVSGQLKGFADQLSALKNETGTTNITYLDILPPYSSCFLQRENDSTPVELHSLQNFLNISTFFQKDGVAIIRPNNPGNNEKNLSQQFTVDPNDPLLYIIGEADKKAGDCSISNGPMNIRFESDPMQETVEGKYVPAYWTFPNYRGDCAALGAPIMVKIATVNSSDTLEQAIADGAGLGDTAATGDQAPKCEDIGGLAWILCKILDGMDAVASYAEDQISSFLFVDPKMFTNVDPISPNGKNGIYNAWSTFRSLSTVIIVIIALIMIFSEAMGQGVFDNYSVKKLLPRLLIAGIAIQLSWFIMTQLVNIFNILGNGIGNLLINPFGLEASKGMKELIADRGYIISGAQGTILGLMAAGVTIALLFSALGLGIMIVAALAVALATLVIRNLLIYLGVVFAPVALALSVLPGTQKASKFWWESFEKALMMYPLVMALFAAGKIMAYLILQAGNPEEGIKSIYIIAAIIAWYAPLFLFPKALQRGGQIMGKVAGFANDKSKGVFDRMRKGRENLRDKRRGWAASKFTPGGSRALNTLARVGAGGNPLSKRKVMQKGNTYFAGETKKASEEMAALNRITDPFQRTQQLKRMATQGGLATKQAALQMMINEGKHEDIRTMIFNGDIDPNSRAWAITRNSMNPQVRAKAMDLAMSPEVMKTEKYTDPSDGKTKVRYTDSARAALAKEMSKASGESLLGQHKSTFDLLENNPSKGLAGIPSAGTAFPKMNSDTGQYTDTDNITAGDLNNLVSKLDALLTNPQTAQFVQGSELGGRLTNLENSAVTAGGARPTPPPPSDLRLKRSVSYIGNIHNFRLYKYQYIWSDTFYVGVMAQDLLESHPEALTIDRYGYYHVDYLRLGIKLQTYEEWLENQKNGAEVAEVAQS